MYTFKFLEVFEIKTISLFGKVLDEFYDFFVTRSSEKSQPIILQPIFRVENFHPLFRFIIYPREMAPDFYLL